MSNYNSASKKQRITLKNSLPWLVVVAILLYAASAGLSDKQYQWLQAPDWSRAKLVGKTALRERAPLALDGRDNIYLLIFPQPSTATILALDSAGDIRWEETIAADLDSPTQPELLWHQSELHAFWLDNEQVYQTILFDVGETAVSPETSDATPLPFPISIANYATAITAEGLQIWAGGTRTEPGIYAYTDTVTTIDPTGIQPILQVDKDGYLHAIWSSRKTNSTAAMLYGGTTPNANWFAEPVELAEISSGSGARLRGPWFSLENGRGYLAWSTEFTSGLSAGQSLSQSTTFALEPNTVARPPVDFKVPYRRQRDYLLAPDAIQAGNRISIPEGGRGRQASPIDGQSLVSSQAAGQEGLLALRVTVEYLKQRDASQIALYYLKEGANNGYQILSFSAAGSMNPAVSQGNSGDIFVSWLERSQGTGNNVYLAGTTAALQQSFAQLTLQDFGIFILETLFGLLQSASFAPFSFLIWATAPLIIIVATAWLRKEGQPWQHPAILIPLGLALIIFWVAKYITLRDALWYVPFSAWIPIIPVWLGLPLRILTPLIITGIAAYLAWIFSYKRSINSLLLLFFLYAGIDTVLSMSVYGGILYNAL